MVRGKAGSQKEQFHEVGLFFFCSLKRIQKQGHIVFARKLQYESHRFMLIFRCVLSAIQNVTWFEGMSGVVMLHLKGIDLYDSVVFYGAVMRMVCITHRTCNILINTKRLGV